MPVANVSTTRKFGIAAQVLGRQVGKTRLATAALSGLRVAAHAVSHVLHILWLEVTGFIFLGLAAIGAFALAREYTKYQAGLQGPGRLVVAACFCLTFGYFGVSSFWRVRKKARAQERP